MLSLTEMKLKQSPSLVPMAIYIVAQVQMSKASNKWPDLRKTTITLKLATFTR